jgi:biopolymer transport protein ExbB
MNAARPPVPATRLLRRVLLSLLLTPPLLAAAQAPTAPASAAVSLDDAYKREFALLETQKRELGARLDEVRQQFERDRGRLGAEISQLEARAIAAQAQAERLADQALRADQQSLAQADDGDMLAATLEQARSTLSGFGDETLQQDAAALPEAERLALAYRQATMLLARLGSVRVEPGEFFLADGSEVSGTLVRFGNIAVFGTSAAGSGALAPAGGGRLRLWNAPAAAATAETLASGRMPVQLNAYLFENANIAVAESEAKTIWGEVQKGGLIGYVILLLGACALVLILLRALFLQRAGASIVAILDAVQPAVRAGSDQAIAAVKRFKGSAARVVTAALRNIDREREHLEDIVSESILHESSRLARFGAVIMTIAAVAPLLGLLGTVTGMIQTFDVITEFGTSDPKLLSGGIATALVTTELGLIVAIPCLLAGSLLNGWAERIKDDMEKAALRAINLYHGARAEPLPASGPATA